MKTEKELFETYPQLFTTGNYNCELQCRGFGLECNEGWYGIIEAWCRAVKQQCRWAAESYNYKEKTSEVAVYPSIICIKEKFGTMNIWSEFPDTKPWVRDLWPKIAGITEMAEEMSRITCEYTGKPGRMCKRGGWYRTVCEDFPEWIPTKDFT